MTDEVARLMQPDARPIAGDKYRLQDDYTYTPPSQMFSITVPRGFGWDGASVPRFLWTLSGIRPDGLVRAAALVHDYLYRHRGKVPGCYRHFSRKRADLLFHRMILDAGESKLTAYRAYWAVRLFGWLAWNKRTTIEVSEEPSGQSEPCDTEPAGVEPGPDRDRAGSPG